jgi:urease accessory protein
MRLKAGSSILLALMGVIFTPLAQAHMATTGTMGLVAGFVHPLTGADHVLAAVAVGIWAAGSGGSHARSVVAAFLALLGLGAIAGFAGVTLVLVEPLIALSVVAMGALILLRVSLPRMVAPAVAGGFALFHGYAHAAAELPVMASAVWWYLPGLLSATLLLLSSGVALGRWLLRSESHSAVELTGGYVALVGSLLLASV